MHAPRSELDAEAHQGIHDFPREKVERRKEIENRLDVTLAGRLVPSRKSRLGPEQVASQPVLQRLGAAPIQQPASGLDGRLELPGPDLHIRFVEKRSLGQRTERGDFALLESTRCFVTSSQSVFGAPHSVKRERLVAESQYHSLHQRRCPTRPTTAHHFVARGQHIIRPLQAAERGSSVDQGLRDLLLKSKRLTRPEATKHVITDSHSMREPAQPEKQGTLVNKGLCDLFQKSSRLARRAAPHYLLVDGQCFVRPVKRVQ